MTIRTNMLLTLISTTHQLTLLLPWLLARIHSNPTLLPKIESETAPSATESQPPNTLSIAEPPRLTLNVERLMHSSPTLTACFHECLRLDTSPVLTYKVQKDFTISEPRKAMFGAEQPPAYLLRAGELLAIPLALHAQDPGVFGSPQTFKPERFLVASEKGEGRETANVGELTPWRSSEATCLGMEFQERAVLAFVAGLLALWDFEPVGRGRWVMPKHRAFPNFMEPGWDIRVRVRRRGLT